MPAIVAAEPGFSCLDLERRQWPRADLRDGVVASNGLQVLPTYNVLCSSSNSITYTPKSVEVIGVLSRCGPLACGRAPHIQHW